MYASPKFAKERSPYYVISGEHGTGNDQVNFSASRKWRYLPKDTSEFDQAFASATGNSVCSDSSIYDFIHGMIYKDGSESK